MIKLALPTQAEIKHLLHYEPETGVFRWISSTGNQNKPWDVAGSFCHGYRRIKINGMAYAAHRIAWIYMTGGSPKNDIDHINGCKSDNRWSNLRDATCKQNQENVPLRKDNASGFRGVFWYRKYRKWCALVGHNSKRINLGYFDTAEEANEAAEAKRAELFTHDTGRDKANKLI